MKLETNIKTTPHSKGFAIAVLAICFALPGSVRGQTEPVTAEFENAVRTFQFQDYEKAQSLFQKLLYPNLMLEDLDQIRDAREYLGASEWFLGNEDAARQEFTSLLIGWSDHELDPFYYPPDLISFYEALRTELIGLKLIKEKPKPPPENPEGEGGNIYEKETIRVVSPVMPWIPFGVGQFANDNPSLGTVFLVTEIGLLATAITSYYLIVDGAGQASDRGRPLYTTFWVSQGLLLAITGAGIGEALFNFKGTTSTIEKDIKGDSLDQTDLSLLPSVNWQDDGFCTFGISGAF